MVRATLTVSDRVIEAVARETDTDPLELPPLYDVVDGESLDECVAALDDGDLTFSYAGVTVTVSSSGTVQVTDAADDGSETSTGGSVAPGN
jgi:hypothetical protein